MLRTQTITAHPNCVILSSVCMSDDGLPVHRGRHDINTKKVANINKLSPQAVRKVKKAITYMSYLAPTKKIYNPRFSKKFKFKLAFITLTLSSRQQHTDQEIKRALLHPFLDYLQKVHRVRNYVWKAERQRNGNLHFHLVIDKYVSYEVIRNQWNKYQDSLGYIKSYWAAQEATTAFPNNVLDYLSVNSTDIHSVRKINDLQRYLIKYMIKPHSTNRIRIKRNQLLHGSKCTENKQKLSYDTKMELKRMVGNGRIWGCSHSLSNITGARDFLSNSLYDEVTRLRSDGKCYVKDESYFLYLGFDTSTLERLRCVHILRFLHEYLAEKFGYALPLVV